MALANAGAIFIAQPKPKKESIFMAKRRRASHVKPVHMKKGRKRRHKGGSKKSAIKA